MPHAYVYARVSTMEQYVSGFSIEGQCEVCLKYVQRQGLILGTETNCGLPGVFVDGGKSAFKKKLTARAGGIRLLSALKPGDTVVAVATHRLFRRMTDMVNTMETWVEQAISVRFVDYPTLNMDTANGKAMLYIFAAMAQMKSELISARTKEAIALRKGKTGPKAAKPTASEPEPPSLAADSRVGEIMQEIVRHQEQSKFKFSGTVRAYVRVSTKEQTVEQQQLLISQYLPDELRGNPPVWYVDEGESAYSTSLSKRKSGKVLLDDLKPGDIVVAWRTDRVFRSLMDMAKMVHKIHAAGAYLHIVEGELRTDTQMGHMMVSMITLMAEMESQDISRATKLGLTVALSSNEEVRKQRLPKMFRGMKDHHNQKHFSFNRFFTAEDRLHMHYQLYLTQHHFKDRRTACRVVSNQWLDRKGLPPVTGEFGNTVGTYVARLKAMQKEYFSRRRDEVIKSLKKYKADTIVQYPIDVCTIAWVWTNMTKYLEAAKRIKGRIRDKQTLVDIARSCSSPENADGILQAISGHH